MYKNARIKLTLVYSILFLSLFWILSLSLYLWFSQSLGEGYITRVRQRHLLQPVPVPFNVKNVTTVRIAGGVALDQLSEILLALNVGLILVVPALGWIITGRTLKPIEKSTEQQKQFVSDASHEMRTPLSIISAELEYALQKRRSVNQYQKVIKSSKEEIKRLSQLINNLLFLARADIKREKINLQEIDLTDLLHATISKYSKKISRKKIRLKFIPSDSNVNITGQLSMLQMLFDNLLDNAVKYTPEKGKIDIKITDQKDHVQVIVKDTGIGIEKKEQEKIFNRFYRADYSRSKEKGFGLGLSLVKSVINSHRGNITVSSTPGKGTAFIVFLPKSRILP